MTPKEAAIIMQIEKTCVLRQDTPDCNRDECGCQNCDLIQKTVDIIEAYEMAIRALNGCKEVPIAVIKIDDSKMEEIKNDIIEKIKTGELWIIPKKGHWITEEVERDILYPTGKRWVCSVCGKSQAYGGGCIFCMNCGADMKKQEEDI